MKAASAGLRAGAALAILFLMGFGLVVYAVPQATASSSSSQGSDSSALAPSAVAGDLSYSLVPLPDYLSQPVPANYPFQEGGALIVIYGDTLEITTSFVGSPGTTFVTVVETEQSNTTAGATTTNPTGAGVFHGSIALVPGSYQVGLLLFVSGQTSSPVAVSNPRYLDLTLYSTSSTTSTSRTESRSTTTSTTSTSSTKTSTASGTSASSGVTASLKFVAASPTAAAVPGSYPYGSGSGAYVVSGGAIFFSLAFAGQVSGGRFSVVLSVNGSAKSLGEYTTNGQGEGSFVGNATLGAGESLLGLTIQDLASFSAPTTVLVSVPATFVVTSQGPNPGSTSSSRTSSTRSETSTPIISTSVTGITVPQGPDWIFRLEASTSSNAPSGYRYATSGTAIVTFDAKYSLLYVELGFQGANPNTAYVADVTINGTSMNLGSMTTNKAGGAELKSSLEVNPGTYVIGILVYDISDIAEFGASGPVLVMVSNPATQLAAFPSPNGSSSYSSSTEANSTSLTQSTVSTVTETVTTLKAGTSVQNQIQTALNNLTIPAAVQVTPLASTTAVYDSRFSLSVGQVAGNGIVVAISGENVTGSRVLLVNMSKTAPLALYPALNVTLDGVPVAEASSAVQVLNPTPANPPYYVLVATSDSIQLLVSIPHFSVHLIQISGVIVHTIETAVSVDGPLLVGSIAVITLAFLGAYASRKRYFML